MFAFFGVPLLLIGVIFAWTMFTGTETQSFTSPSGERELEITRDCRFGPCIGNGELEYEIGGASASIQCGPFPEELSDWLFAGAVRAEWSGRETRLTFRRTGSAGAGGQAAEKTLDFVESCRHQVQVTWRGNNIVGFRFRENCLSESCRRSVIVVHPGADYLYIPCRIDDLPGRKLVFSTGDDHDANMQVELDEQARRAEWTSLSTGATGTLDLQADCDRARQWRGPAPP